MRQVEDAVREEEELYGLRDQQRERHEQARVSPSSPRDTYLDESHDTDETSGEQRGKPVQQYDQTSQHTSCS